MSRIGKKTIDIPKGVEVSLTPDYVVKVKGAKGALEQKIVSDKIKINIQNDKINLEALDANPQTRAFHGLYRMLISNMIEGITKGFKRQLELVGVGYRASVQGDLLDLSIGYSHNIVLQFPSDVKINAIHEKGSNPTIVIEGIDKQLVGLVASKIRSLRKPEPYQGKGIRYTGEYIRRKAGKSAAK